MKKILLAVFMLLGTGITVNAQKIERPTPVQEPNTSRNPELFSRLTTQTIAAINGDDIKGAHTLLPQVMSMMMNRGDELARSKATMKSADNARKMGQELKNLSSDVTANKTALLELLNKMQRAY